MPVKKRIIFLHLIGCFSFLLLPFLFFPHPSQTLAPLSDPAMQRDIISQVLLIGFFYLNYFLFIPAFYFKKKLIAFTLLMAACFISILVLPSIFTNHFEISHSNPPDKNFPAADRQPPPPAFNHPEERPAPGNFHQAPAPPMRPQLLSLSSFFDEVSHHIFLFLVVLFFSLNLAINNRWKQVQQEKSDAELSYLKAQINPHFLFNILNTIYSLTIQKADAAPEAVVKLAGMMRYVLHEADKDFVALEKEVNYIRDYITLQLLRFNESVDVFFEVKGEAADKKIAPLLLIPFIENAFKHGVNAAENAVIRIEINITENIFQLSVRNNKVHTQQLPEDDGGIGLNNVKIRLQLLYTGRHKLEIQDAEKEFLVMLQLQLT